MKFEVIFPSFVAVDQLEDYLDNDAIVDFCYKRYNDDNKTRYKGGWSSGHLPLGMLEEPALKPLKDQINSRVEKIKKEVGIRSDVEHRIANYWANIFEPTGIYRLPATPPHLHNGYFLSCVYYPKAPEGCGDLCLMAPFNAAEATIPFKLLSSFNIWSASRYLVKPEPAKLVIFPSWIMHWVDINRSNDDRISMAFNIALPSVEL
jgi:uncharacterized protein (TIGR02466 family)